MRTNKILTSIALTTALMFLSYGRTAAAEELSQQAISAPGTTLTWIMVNVNSRDQQGDSHLIFEPDGAAILIDTGTKADAELSLIPLLKQLGIKKLAAVFITHPHHDHSGGLLPLMSSGVTIAKIYMGEVSQAKCEAESYSCIWPQLLEIRASAAKFQIPITSYRDFQSFEFKSGASFTKLYQVDEKVSPLAHSSMNDFSLLGMLTVGKTRALFLGDLNKELSEWLLTHSKKDFRAELLKFPHHGVDGFAVTPFILQTAAKDILIPAPKRVWCMERANRTKEIIRQLEANVYLNGLHGNVRVYFHAGGYKISADNKFAPDVESLAVVCEVK